MSVCLCARAEGCVCMSVDGEGSTLHDTDECTPATSVHVGFQWSSVTLFAVSVYGLTVTIATTRGGFYLPGVVRTLQDGLRSCVDFRIVRF